MPQAYCTECRTHTPKAPVSPVIRSTLPSIDESRGATLPSQTTLVVALRQVRQSLTTTDAPPTRDVHRQPGSGRPTSPEVPRRPGEEQRPRWPRSGERPHRVTPPRRLSLDQPAPVRPQVDGTGAKGVNSPLAVRHGRAAHFARWASPSTTRPVRPGDRPAAPAPLSMPEAPGHTIGTGRACSV